MGSVLVLKIQRLGRWECMEFCWAPISYSEPERQLTMHRVLLLFALWFCTWADGSRQCHCQCTCSPELAPSRDSRGPGREHTGQRPPRFPHLRHRAHGKKGEYHSWHEDQKKNCETFQILKWNCSVFVSVWWPLVIKFDKKSPGMRVCYNTKLAGYSDKSSGSSRIKYLFCCLKWLLTFILDILASMFTERTDYII